MIEEKWKYKVPVTEKCGYSEIVCVLRGALSTGVIGRAYCCQPRGFHGGVEAQRRSLATQSGEWHSLVHFIITILSSRVDAVVMGCWCNGQLVIWAFTVILLLSSHWFNWNNSFCQIPAHYTSTASNIRNLPITPGLLYLTPSMSGDLLSYDVRWEDKIYYWKLNKYTKTSLYLIRTQAS